MIKLAHRLRGRRGSRRQTVDEVEVSASASASADERSGYQLPSVDSTSGCEETQACVEGATERKELHHRRHLTRKHHAAHGQTHAGEGNGDGGDAARSEGGVVSDKLSRAPSGKSAKTLTTSNAWKKNRGINSKTSSSVSAYTFTASPAVPAMETGSTDDHEQRQQEHARADVRTASTHASAVKQASPVPHQRLLPHAHSKELSPGNSLRLQGMSEDRAACISSSSSERSVESGGSAGRRTRSRHGGSVSSSSGGGSVSNAKPEASVEVLHSGYLVAKRGLLKVAEKRYYFVARRHAELYCCKDKTSFNLWLSSGHPLEGDVFSKVNGLTPVLVSTVLRADSATAVAENGTGGPVSSHPERSFSVVAGSSSKCTTLRFTAESAEMAALWLEALHEVQVTKRHHASRRVNGKIASASEMKLLLPLNEHNALSASNSAASASASGECDEEIDAQSGSKTVSLDADGSNEIDASSSGDPSREAEKKHVSAGKVPRVYTGGRLQNKPRPVEEDTSTAVSTPTSHTNSSPTSASASASATSDHAESAPPASSVAIPPPASSTPTHGQPRQSFPPSRSHRMDSAASCSSTASGHSQSAAANVVLFVPAAGSTLTVSESKMTRAQQELDALVAKGAKLPSRVKEPDGDEAIQWRYGAPQYVLTDLAYVRGRQREPDTTPLASYVEECCQTFIMEATHKARYDQWHSVCHDEFYLQVNDNERVRGADIKESAMFGLLHLGGIEASGGQGEDEERQDPRAELAEAFPEGFPMEVLEVFTQPPQCYFSWRHWGPFSGKHRGVKGDGSRVELRGFGEMTVDASRMRSLRLFFKQQDLFASLHRTSDRVMRARRAASAAVTPGALPAPASGRTLRAASVAGPVMPRKTSAPTPTPTSAPVPNTNDIIEGLANFTLEAKEQHRKQTQ